MLNTNGNQLMVCSKAEEVNPIPASFPPDEAAYQLQEAVSILTGVGQRKSKKKATAKPKASARPKSGGLDSLLDSWEVN